MVGCERNDLFDLTSSALRCEQIGSKRAGSSCEYETGRDVRTSERDDASKHKILFSGIEGCARLRAY